MIFEEFYKKYHLKLNKQQVEAVKSVDGPVLLLAVPGSGKTTVLVTRLGYMVNCLGIAPEQILTLTYTVAATKDMASRFESYFGDQKDICRRMEFRTINGICARVIYQYGKMIGKKPFELISDDKNTTGMLSMIYQKVENAFATESDLMNVRTWISYIKNMMLSKDEVQELNEEAGCNISDIYQEYNKELKRQGLMDYDDQMTYAYTILRKVPAILNYYQEKYRYICVDEAQDTSKIQHVIISLLASKYENLFMVGDEDQSIYGFRAAYPEALLDFEKQHKNAKVLLMEDNFRSNARIVSAADRFIQKNTLRHKKHMRATRQEGSVIREVELKSRNSQYNYLVKIAENCETQTAVLYREHESVLPLVDLLERKGIAYRMRNADLSFFSHRIVLDIENIINFALNPYDTELFKQIYYKISTYLNKQKAMEICDISERMRMPVLEAAVRYGKLKGMTVGSCKSMQTHLENLLEDKAEYAIQRIVQYMGYGDYLERAGLSDSKIAILKALAKQETTAEEFVNRLDDLQKIILEKQVDYQCPFILSTIHASKGLEFDTVYLMDVADGIFPENIPRNIRNAEKKELETYEEERRLFYVAVTRAKNELAIFKIGKPSTFCKQLLGNSKTPESKEKAKTVPKKVSSKVFSEVEYQRFLEGLGEGVLVKHKKFGNGVVIDLTGEKIMILFDDSVRALDTKICFRQQLLKVK